jgi:hypothetical protein
LHVNDYVADSFGKNFSYYWGGTRFWGGVLQYGNESAPLSKRWEALGIDYTVQVDSPLNSMLRANDIVTLYPGCDGYITTCNNVFNNLTNFVGMPYMPQINPEMWGLK